MRFIKKLFLPEIALVLLLNAFSINTSSAKAATPEIENTDSQLSGDNIVPSIDGKLPQLDGDIVSPLMGSVNLIVEWKNEKNYSVLPVLSRDYDPKFKLYSTTIGLFTHSDRSESITTLADIILNKTRTQYYRTYTFY